VPTRSGASGFSSSTSRQRARRRRLEVDPAPFEELEPLGDARLSIVEDGNDVAVDVRDVPDLRELEEVPTSGPEAFG